MKMNSWPTFFALLLFCVPTLCSGEGILIFGHFGATDPTSEGFTLLQSGRPALAPVTNDLGLAAWHIGLDTAADIGQYTRNLTTEEQVAIEAGWILTMTLRIVEPFDTPTFGTFAGYPAVLFGAQSDGDPILQVGISEYVLEDAGSGYHTYQLRYDADLGLANLWADGVLLDTEIAVPPNPSASFGWGGGQHPPGSAYANWNEVSLWAIPEPSSLALLGLGGLWLVSRLLMRRLD